MTQIAIYRSRKQYNSLGVLGPVSDMAVLGMGSDSTRLTWVSTLYTKRGFMSTTTTVT